MNLRPIVALLGAVVWLAALPPAANADGIYMPAQAFPAMPEIPVQRALIVHHDGEETLVVESAMKTESPEVGWILPLPAEPRSLEVADGGMLTTLTVCLGPKVIHDLHDETWTVIVLLVLLVPVVLLSVFRKNGLDMFGVATVAIWFLLLALLSPDLGTAGSTGGPATAGAVVSSQERVGSYEVSVLRARDGESLSRWLTDNGLRPLDAEAGRIVADYIAEGWCFAVARLRREGDADATPHPIMATFPTAKPVYPMRLTALAGSKTHVELYVIADGMAQAKGFALAAADGFQKVTAAQDWRFGWRYHVGRPDGLAPDPLLAARRGTGLVIGSADVARLGWDGCVVSRLEADLAPKDMKADIELTWAPVRPYRETVFSWAGRLRAAEVVLLWGALVLVVLVTVVCRKRRWPTRRTLKVMGFVAAAAVLVAAGVAFSHRAIPVGRDVRFIGAEFMHRELGRAAEVMAAKGQLQAGMTRAEWEAFPKRVVEFEYLLPGTMDNPFTGGPMRYERSPGNFSTRVVDGATWFCTYDRYGIETRVCKLPGPEPESEPRP
jgi:hypothetical protein